MEFFLPYHQRKIKFSLPFRVPVALIKPRRVLRLKDPLLTIQNVFPQDTFDEFFKKEDKVVIIVSDITRYSGAEIFLPFLLNRLKRKGVSDKNVTIVFSLGIHRLMSREEQIKVVGKEVAQRVRMENHNARGGDLVYLGKTKRGTPVIVNRKVVEADKVILTGTIGYHYLAGFG
ncbi:MAG: lactate racemase domain-containing protein, partial [Desulfobacterota bacterium]|nr:lactate racemase domain-containing protein [Thermodesulfobacteriota bacterium]